MNMPEIDDIDDLLKEYELQKREVYINRTIPGIDRLERIAYNLASAYEREYRANPTYENEERMRYWRYMGAAHWSSKADGTYYEGPNTECILRKREYDELVQRHAKATEHVDEKRHENPNARDNKNTLMLIGLTIGINVLVHIFFVIAS